LFERDPTSSANIDELDIAYALMCARLRDVIERTLKKILIIILANDSEFDKQAFVVARTREVMEDVRSPGDPIQQRGNGDIVRCLCLGLVYSSLICWLY
jgi:hypothetical protein